MNADFTAQAVAARRLRLLAEPAENAFAAEMPRHGDHQLNHLPMNASARPAAVLVPLVAHASGLTVLLTRRAAAMREHSGQIAFPGGKIDTEDGSPLAAALREAEEEIGLNRRHIELLGYLDAYQTGTGFRIQPVVALVTPPFTLALHAGEVEAAFEVPLMFLMDAANHQRHSRKFSGHERFFYAMPWGEHFLWGATAGILRNLYERLYS